MYLVWTSHYDNFIGCVSVNIDSAIIISPYTAKSVLLSPLSKKLSPRMKSSYTLLFFQKSKYTAVRHIFNKYTPRTSTSLYSLFNTVLSLPSRCVAHRIQSCRHIPFFILVSFPSCIYAMKHGDYIWSPLRKQTKQL